MSETESEISQNSITNDSTEEEEDFTSISSVFMPYQFEPLAVEPAEEQNTEETEDADGILPDILESRYDKTIPASLWCKCGNCKDDLLVGSLEYRCCREVLPVVGMLVFDGSIEHIQCITAHEDYKALTNTAVLKQVGPFLKDKNGRSYRKKAGQGEKEYLRAVAYRMVVRWLCGPLGWDNSRPLPACVYHNIRAHFVTGQAKGYASVHERS